MTPSSVNQGVSKNVFASLSIYDQSLGAGPPLTRMLCFNYLPDFEAVSLAFEKALEKFPRFVTSLQNMGDGSLALVKLPSVQTVALQPRLRWMPEKFDVAQLPLFVDVPDCRVPDQPVLTAMLTPVSNGAVIGVGVSHGAGDAHSLRAFLACWSAHISTSAHRSGQMIVSRNSSPDGELVHHPKNQIIKNWPIDNRRSTRSHYFDRIRFTKVELEALRTTLTNAKFVPTLNEALTAFILHRYGRRMLGQFSKMRVRIPVNMRGLHPLLSVDYVGNAFLEATLSLEDAVDSPIAACRTAQSIRSSIAKVVNRARLDPALSLKRNHVELDARDIPPFNRQTDVLSTNFTKMPLHELDFGKGPPTNVFCVLSVETGFVILPTLEGIEVQLVNRNEALSLAL